MANNNDVYIIVGWLLTDSLVSDFRVSSVQSSIIDRHNLIWCLFYFWLLLRLFFFACKRYLFLLLGSDFGLDFLLDVNFSFFCEFFYNEGENDCALTKFVDKLFFCLEFITFKIFECATYLLSRENIRSAN
jgi:hypothetical protein